MTFKRKTAVDAILKEINRDALLYGDDREVVLVWESEKTFFAGVWGSELDYLVYEYLSDEQTWFYSYSLPSEPCLPILEGKVEVLYTDIQGYTKYCLESIINRASITHQTHQT